MRLRTLLAAAVLSTATATGARADTWRTLEPLGHSVPPTDQLTVLPDGTLLVVNHGHNNLFPLSADGGPLSLSALADGRWTSLTPAEPSLGISSPDGPALNPADGRILWFGSVLHGLARLDISGQTPPLALGREGDPRNGEPWFHPIVADQTGPQSWKESCSFTAPVFDTEGRMWSVFADYDNQTVPGIDLFLWAPDASPPSPQRMRAEGLAVSNIALLKALRHGPLKGMLLYASRLWGDPLALIDPGDGSPAVVSLSGTMTDQDGNVFEPERINFVEEDPDGSLWVGCSRGIFRLDPADLPAPDWKVTRPKVSRGDGSGFADRLLDGVPVNAMATDGAGNRWFATSGAGLVATSPDGRTVLRNFTEADSPLPGDMVYGVAWMGASNSLAVSSSSGLHELLPSLATGPGNTGARLKIWPNPVRPGYTGFVTIEGLPADASVTITDDAGRVLRLLTAGPDGTTLWDVTDSSRRRPASGVCHILASSPDGSRHVSSKLLIVNN